jgi:CRISPR/Cas system type I-B associated protein Csh2 (Cas7 group RAMP superfamily)
MSKKLSKKERGEVVTKGYLHDVLDDKLRNYVTKDYMESKNYVTKDYLDERFIKFRKEINKDFAHHTGVLMEDNHDTIKTLIEAFENRFERIDRRLDTI